MREMEGNGERSIVSMQRKNASRSRDSMQLRKRKFKEYNETNCFQDEGQIESDLETEESLGYRKTPLIDVHLSVKANRRAEHVPFVCLVSQLNQRAILGHPVEVEEITDGSRTCPKMAIIDRKLFNGNGSKFHQLVWAKSKRSPVMYVSNSHSSPAGADEQPVRSNPLAGEEKFQVKSGQKGAAPLRGTCVPVKHVFEKIQIAVGQV